MNRFYRNLLAAAGLTLSIAACQEQLTAPGACPATCPGGTPVVHDTVLEAIPDSDVTYTGYLPRGTSSAGLRVSNGLNGSVDYAVINFDTLPDSLFVRDTGRTYVIDSIAIELTLLARDTLVNGVRIDLHRLIPPVDTSVTFAALDPLIVPGNLIDSVTVADSVRPNFKYRFVFQGDTLDLVKTTLTGDSATLNIAVAISAPSPTGIRISGIASAGAVAGLVMYATADVPDTAVAIKKQTIPRFPLYTTYVQSVPPGNDPDLLYVGTSSVARSFIRFPWPAYLRDSALLARATLELTPAAPLTGLPGDSIFLVANGVRVDFGPKSPLSNVLGGVGDLFLGSSDTILVDVISEIVFWQSKASALPHPPIFILSMTKEGGSFTEPSFFSTRSAGGAPRLRVTYQLPFDFERP